MAQTERKCTIMGNEERNSYVKKQITSTFINLLKQRDFADITISQITGTANVSRNSFYRNYTTKEDIILQYLRSLMREWEVSFAQTGSDSNAERYGSLFAHLKENGDFFMLLKKQNLIHLFLTTFIELYGAKPEQDNTWAYVVSFIAYGTYGWIEEWIARGMQESAETMSALLASQGMK